MAPVVAVLALVVMGVAVVAWQQAERAADDAEAAADSADDAEAAARVATLEGLLRPESLYAFLDVYDAISSAVCTDQHTPTLPLVEQEVADASEDDEPLAAYEGWELAVEVDAAQAARDRCSASG